VSFYLRFLNFLLASINHTAEFNSYYSGYLAFFTNALLENGATATFEKYVFSQTANFDPAKVGDGQTQPGLLNRFVGGLLHPMIHVGYGLEFGLLGTLAEGSCKGKYSDLGYPY
jgi:hypothetical protein